MDLDSRYELLEIIGKGSFAKVYRARDQELGREVAIKQIHEQYLDDPAQLERFWQEAQLLASLSHPNIVTIYDLHRERGWVIMELMQASLAERFDDRQMPIASVRTTLAHGLRALKYLHARGIVHGDIKPSNLMIDSRRRIKIGDFGLARRVSDEEGSLIKGTTKYMAPEVVSEEFGEIGPSSDLYSLGFCAYELMCGPNFESLFPGLSAFGRNKQIAWMMWHAAADRRLPPIAKVLDGVPEDLAAVVEKLIDKKQSARYASSDQALSGLKVDLKLVKSEDPEELAAEEEAEERAGKKRLLMAGGAFAFSLVLCLFLLFFPGTKPTEPPKQKVFLVMEVFPDQNVIKVEDLDRTFAKEISLGKNPRIYLTNSEKNIVLRELQPGDRIEIETENGGSQLNITASHPIQNRGIIKNIDRTNNRVWIAVAEGKVREELELRVPERAEITTLMNGKPQKGALRNVSIDDEVTVTHLDELGEKPGRFVVKLAVKQLEEGVGFVAHRDLKNRRLTISHGIGQSSRIMLPLALNCEITFEGEPISFADVQHSDRVRYRYDTEFHELFVLRDQAISKAMVKNVLPEKTMLELSDAEGKPRTFRVPPDCEITIARNPATLTDLRQYDTVDLTWRDTDDLKEATSILVTRRRVDQQRAALLIGVEKYDDFALTRLSFPIANVQGLRQQLVDRYAFNPDRMTVLTDPSQTQLREETQQFLSRVGRSTQVIIYLCGHIYKTSEENYVIAPRQFRWDNRKETGVPVQWLIQELENCPSENKMLLMDTCHSGFGGDLKFQPSPKVVIESLPNPPKTTTVIGNCDEGETGHLIENEKYSLFAHELIQGFGGPADANRDLKITPTELFDYLKSTIGKAKIPGGRSQTPVRIHGKS